MAKRIPKKQSSKIRFRPTRRVGIVVMSLIAVSSVASGLWLKSQSPKDVLGTYTVVASVGGNPPTTGAVIDTPLTGATTTNNEVTVAGTCLFNTFVNITRNGVNAGSINCSGSSTFSLNIQLLVGTNTLVAQTFDLVDQPGPDSNIVVITREAIPAPDPEPTDETPIIDPVTPAVDPEETPTEPTNPVPELFITSSQTHKRLGISEDINWPVSVQGGTAPYALTIDWGDGTNDSAPIADNKENNLHHAYTKSGVFSILVEVRDSNNGTASIRLSVSVATATISPNVSTNNPLRIRTVIQWKLVLPISTGVIVLILVLWLGRRFII